MGGDEFTVLLEGISAASGAEKVAERIIRALSVPFSIGGHLIYITVSIGIALSDTAGVGSGDLLRAADIALCRAKDGAKARYEIFDTQNKAQARGAYDTCKLLVREAAKQGYGEYRAHLDFMDLAAEQYSFNDHAYRRFNETIKDALDPNGILSPGKQGIWPKGMRESNGG